MNTVRRTLHSLLGKPVSSQDRNGVDHLHDNSGASECVRPPYRGPDADARAQEGVGGVVLPSARARAATPQEHREGAALQEKPTNLVVASAADDELPPAASIARTDRADERPKPKRRRRDDENPKHTKVSLRVTPEEKADIENRAKAAKLSVAHYLARKVFSEDSFGLGGRDASLDAAVDELRATRRQHAGAMSNLNQLGRDYNSGIDLQPAAVQDAATAVHRAFEAGLRLLDRVDSAASGLAKAKRR
ncbi:plasmid mobilization protein [Kitasatospora sp. NPDC048194]|uniref:plasmid mobilization protein n=1 Tax=Kitasatospora sp. NPDC048194 TaxID=3364045 RepID=UPI0037124D86